MKTKFKSLKDAKKDDDIASFIKQHEDEPSGDEEKFYKTIESISHPENLKSTQETSVQDSSEN
jgi:hypothetical protein